MCIVTYFLKKDNINKLNEWSIYLKIEDLEYQNSLNSGISIEECYWDIKNQNINFTHPLNKYLNSHLNKIKDKIQYLIKIKEIEKINFNINKWNFKNDAIDFFEYCDSILENYKKKGEPKSKNFKYVILLFKKFLNRNKIKFNEINLNLINRYELFLIKNNYATNTIKNNFCYLNFVFKNAIVDKIINHSNNPFYKYRIKKKLNSKNYLSELEINSINDLNLEKDSPQDKARDIFIFGCYLGGIRISDMLILKHKNIDENFIVFTARKNNKQNRIKIHPISQKIIDKYKSENTNVNDYIFPYLKDNNGLFEENDLLIKIRRVTNQLNKCLKIIARKTNIEKKITIHVSRHTFANRAINKGIRLEVVSKILGHSTIQQTLNYIKISQSDLDEAMDMFND
jgi:site-specific recombinase XerD